jgi:hypothetical protein
MEMSVQPAAGVARDLTELLHQIEVRVRHVGRPDRDARHRSERRVVPAFYVG